MLWWCSLLMATTSSDESELEFAPECVKTFGAADAQRLQFDPARHAVFSDGDFSDGDFSGAEAAGTAAQPAPAVVNATGQGSYSREDAAKKRTHADQARAAFWRVQSSALAGACESTCTLGCENRVTRDELFSCIEASYGMISWISAADLKVSKRKPSLSYGKDVEHEGESGRWVTTKKARETGDEWADLFDSFVTFNATGKARTAFSVAGEFAVPAVSPVAAPTITLLGVLA